MSDRIAFSTKSVRWRSLRRHRCFAMNFIQGYRLNKACEVIQTVSRVGDLRRYQLLNSLEQSTVSSQIHQSFKEIRQKYMKFYNTIRNYN